MDEYKLSYLKLARVRYGILKRRAAEVIFQMLYGTRPYALKELYDEMVSAG